MKKTLLSALILTFTFSAFASRNPGSEDGEYNPPNPPLDQLRSVACAEAARKNFQFETSCEDEFIDPIRHDGKFFEFRASDRSGDCGISVLVDARAFSAWTRIECQ